MTAVKVSHPQDHSQISLELRLQNKTREFNALSVKLEENNRSRGTRLQQLHVCSTQLPLKINRAIEETHKSLAAIRAADQKFINGKFASFENKRDFIQQLDILLKIKKGGSKRNSEDNGEHQDFIFNVRELCREFFLGEKASSSDRLSKVLFEYLVPEAKIAAIQIASAINHEVRMDAKNTKENKITADWIAYANEPPSEPHLLEARFIALQGLIENQLNELIDFNESRERLIRDYNAKVTLKDALQSEARAIPTEIDKLIAEEKSEMQKLAIAEIELATIILQTPFTRDKNFAKVIQAHHLLRREGIQYEAQTPTLSQSLRNDFLDVLRAANDNATNPIYKDYYATIWELEVGKRSTIELASHIRLYSYQLSVGQIKNHFDTSYAKLICLHADVPIMTAEEFAFATNLNDLLDLDEKLQNLRTYGNDLPKDYSSAVHKLVDDLCVMRDIFKLKFTKGQDFDKKELLSGFKECFIKRIEQDLPSMNIHRELRGKLANILLAFSSIFTGGLVAIARLAYSSLFNNRTAFWFSTHRGEQLESIRDEAIAIKVC